MQAVVQSTGVRGRHLFQKYRQRQVAIAFQRAAFLVAGFSAPFAAHLDFIEERIRGLDFRRAINDARRSDKLSRAAS